MREVEKASVLKQTLKTLCVCNGWSYGAFWRFDKPNSMLLTMEDAYYEEQVVSIMNNMVLQIHMVGEGVIGQAAFSGNHKWVVSDGEWNSFRSVKHQSVFQDDSEFRFQFFSGIKTIAVIPVEPRGVVQFGSTMKIPERIETLDQTKRLFRDIKHMLSSEPREIYDLNGVFASLISTSNSNNGDVAPVSADNNGMNLDGYFPFRTDFCNGRMNFSQRDVSHFGNQLQNSRTKAHVLLSDEPTSQCQQYFLHSSSSVTNDSVDKRPCTWTSECSDLASFESQFPSENNTQDPSDVILLKPNSFNVEGDTKPASSYYYHGTLAGTEKHVEGGCTMLMDNWESIPSSFTTNNPKQYHEEISDNLKTADDLSQWVSSLPDQNISEILNALNDDDSELIESAAVSSGLVVSGALVDIPKKHPSKCSQSSFTNAFNAQGQEISRANQSAEKNLHVGCIHGGDLLEDIIKPVRAGSCTATSSLSKCSSELDVKSAAFPQKGLFSKFGLEELLAGMNTCNSVTKSDMDSLSSPTKRTKKEVYSMNDNQVDGARLSRSNGNMNLVRCNKEFLPKSQVGLWIDDSYSITEGSVILSQPHKSEGHAKAIRKKARPGESSRPRPKDRQQIQDRIKELKGIIPNGSKCSIDSLLDRTIKYMLFLQGVTKYADKLKQADEPNLLCRETSKLLKDNNACDGGAGFTWAFEVGSQSMVCPIIVEDLNSPGQMLIEMLCKEQGLFLEIADKIRGFGLNILKGVMEVIENKIWARFIVEANRHVTRIEVFWSLVGLLQETKDGGIDTIIQPSSEDLLGLLDSYQKPKFQPPISLAETLS